MKPTATTPAWVLVSTGVCLGAIALAALRIDVLNNYHYGLTEGGAEMAAVMVIAALCVGLLPVAAAIYGWSLILRSMTIFCVLLTCWCAVNAYAQKMGDSILSKTSQASAYAGAEKDQAAARETLARIKETADTSALESLIDAAKAKALVAEKSDSNKMGSPSCFKGCKAAQAEHMALLGRLSEAKARDAAKRELAAAKQEAKAGTAEASMVATWIAARTQTDATDIARSIALAMTLLGIVVTQGAALLAHTAATLIGAGFRKSGLVKEEAPAEVSPVTVAKNNVVSIKILEKREDETLERLVSMILRSPNSTIICSARELARRLEVSNSTFNVWLTRWTQDGRIKCETVSAHKKRFAAS